MLTIEDGSGSNPAADSYATVAELIQFCTDYGYVPLASGTEEAFLRRACAAMERMHWVGVPTSPSDPLLWPRQQAYRRDRYMIDGPLPSDEIPADIKKGQMQLAVELSLIAASPEVEAGATGKLTSITETVSGAVSRSKTFDNTGRTGGYSPTRISDTFFAPYLSPTGGSVFAVRG